MTRPDSPLALRGVPRLDRVRRLRALIAADPERYVRERLDATAAQLLGALPAGGAA